MPRRNAAIRKGITLNLNRRFVAAIFFLALAADVLVSEPEKTNPTVLDETIRWLEGPSQTTAEYNYVMTGRLRLLLFWAGKDDVGGGYIRFGHSKTEPAMEVIDLTFGSDPEKAPRRINRWGTARELRGVREVDGRRVPTSAFFGFMKATGGESREEIEIALSNEDAARRHVFEASVNRIEPGSARAGTLRLTSDVDFTVHQLDQARTMVLARYRAPNAPIEMRGSAQAGVRACNRSEGFLFAVRAMIESALSDTRSGQSVCYSYNSRTYTLSLEDDSRIDSRRIEYTLHGGIRRETTYRDLRQLDFEVLNHESRNETRFTLLVGTSGELRGVPVQIEHQPNWWFKVVLNLDRNALYRKP